MTTSAATLEDAGPRRSASHATGALLRSEARLLRREPGALIWAVVLPLIAATVLANVPATREPSKSLGGWSFSQVYLPTLIIFTASLLSLQTLPALLAKYREDGILKRLRTTPTSPTNLLIALFLLMGGVSAVVAALMTLIPVASGVPFRGNGLAFALVVVLTLVSFTALGLVLAALSPSSRFANGLGTIALLVMSFFAGLWIPRSTFSDTLATVADWTPSGAASRALLSSMQGDWPTVQSLFVLVLYAAVCAWVAARTFRWE